jgi:CheY-like chemotaxis protein
VLSEIGAGTTMSLYLPRHAGKPEEVEVRAVAAAHESGHGETVLLIEDQDSLRIVLAEMLESAGYQVIAAADGHGGLDVLHGKRRIDILVTDVGLPGGLNGRQVADAGRVVWPGLKVLFITGYAENAAVGDGQLDPGMEVLTKPFDMEALTRRVRQMIG